MRPPEHAEWDAIPPGDRTWDIVWSEYLPGDMAHPVGRGPLEVIDSVVHNPDAWVDGLFVLVVLVVSVAVIVR